MVKLFKNHFQSFKAIEGKSWIFFIFLWGQFFLWELLRKIIFIRYLLSFKKKYICCFNLLHHFHQFNLFFMGILWEIRLFQIFTPKWHICTWLWTNIKYKKLSWEINGKLSSIIFKIWVNLCVSVYF